MKILSATQVRRLSREELIKKVLTLQTFVSGSAGGQVFSEFKEENMKLAGQVSTLEEVVSELQTDVTELKRSVAYLLNYATTDHLTGVPNRKAFELYMPDGSSSVVQKKRKALSAWGTMLSGMIRQMGRNPQVCWGVAMLDIDNFKGINDQHGHLVGDQVLQEVAGTIRDALREEDILSRFGGEEFFCLLMPPSSSEEKETKKFFVDIKLAMERVRLAVEALEINVLPDLIIRVTVSIGIYYFSPDPKGSLEQAQKDLEAARGLADQALYTAKEKGRNRSCFFSEE